MKNISIITLTIASLVLAINAFPFSITVTNDDCGSLAYGNKLNFTVYANESHPNSDQACSFHINNGASRTRVSGDYIIKEGGQVITFDDTYQRRVCTGWHWIKGNGGENILTCDAWNLVPTPCNYIMGPTAQISGALTVKPNEDNEVFYYKAAGLLGCFPHQAE